MHKSIKRKEEAWSQVQEIVLMEKKKNQKYKLPGFRLTKKKAGSPGYRTGKGLD